MNACAEAAVDPEVRVIVLTGAGSMFCLGDVPEMSGLPERFAHRVPGGADSSQKSDEINGCVRWVSAVRHSKKWSSPLVRVEAHNFAGARANVNVPFAMKVGSGTAGMEYVRLNKGQVGSTLHDVRYGYH